MGYDVLVHSWPDSSEGHEAAGQEMPINMEEREMKDTGTCARSAEVHRPTRLLKISQLNIQSRGHLRSVLANHPVQD